MDACDFLIHRSRGGDGGVAGWLDEQDPALTDIIGSSFALMLTPGSVADVTAAPELLARMGRDRYLLNDKGRDADPLWRTLRKKGRDLIKNTFWPSSAGLRASHACSAPRRST